MRKYILPSILIALLATGVTAMYAEESSGAFSDTTIKVESGKDVEKTETAEVEAKEDEKKDEEKKNDSDESTEGFPVEGTVQGDNLRLREWPWGPTMGEYMTGATLKVLAKSGEFYKVEINGKTGYMHVNYVSIPGADASRVAPYYPADTATGGYLPKDQGVAQSKNGTSSGPAGAANVSYQGGTDTGDLASYPGGKLPPAKFIALFGPVARESMKQTGVPASVTLAQAILETGWGGSSIGDAKNLFGIKGTGPAGTTVVHTQECYDGKTYVTIKDGFRKYHTWQESIDDHAKLLQNSRYAPALNAYKQNHDADQYAVGIHQAGYATSPTYAKSLQQLMKQYNLYEWDI